MPIVCKIHSKNGAAVAAAAATSAMATSYRDTAHVHMSCLVVAIFFHRTVIIFARMYTLYSVYTIHIHVYRVFCLSLRVKIIMKMTASSNTSVYVLEEP